MKPYPLADELLRPVLRVAMPRPARLRLSRRPVRQIYPEWDAWGEWPSGGASGAGACRV